MKKVTLLILSILCVVAIYAQSDWTNYQTRNTMFPANPYRSIVIDSNGNKWVGTQNNGIMRFDGTNWTVFNSANTVLRSNRINHLFIDADKNFWIATDGGGLYRRTPEDEWLTLMRSDTSPLWPSNNVTWVTQDEDKTIWVATRNGLVKILTVDPLDYFVFSSPQHPLPSNNITVVHATAQANRKTRWLGTEQGLVKFEETRANSNDGFTEDWKTYNTSNSSLTGNGITNIYFDNTSSMWVSCYNWDTSSSGGLIKFNNPATASNLQNGTVFTTPQLPSNNIRSLAHEVDGTNLTLLWVTTDNGIARYNGTQWILFNRALTGNVLPTNDIYAVTIDKLGGNVKWFGTNHNMTKYDGTSWVNFQVLSAGIPSNNIQAITFDDEGNKWIGTANGLSKFTGTLWEVFNMGNRTALPSNDIRTLAIDKSNYLWIGTAQYNNIGGGVVRYGLGNGVWETYTMVNSALTSHNITKIVVSEDDTKWIATDGGGLISVSAEGAWRVYDQAKTPDIASDFINDVLVDNDDNKWIATNFGISVLDSDNTTFIHRYNRMNSKLPSDNIKKINQDKNGYIWAVTANGLVKLVGNDWIIYNASNTGNVLNPTNITDINFDKDNIKWITTTNGLIRTNEMEWRVYSSSTPGLNSNFLKTINIEEVVLGDKIHNYKWIASADSGVTVFRGGEQLFENGASITVFQHPLITNSLKISAIVNNIIVDRVEFKINRQAKAHTRLTTNTFWTEHLVTQSQAVDIDFTYYHAQGDSTITKRVNVGMLQTALSGFPISTGIDFEIQNDIAEPQWLMVEQMSSSGDVPISNRHKTLDIKIESLKDCFKDNLVARLKTGSSVSYRANALQQWTELPIYTDGAGNFAYINNAGEYRIIESDDTTTKLMIASLTNYPNPFNPSTTIAFSVETQHAVSVLIDIFNIKGQKIRSLVNGEYVAGVHSVVWNGTDDSGNPVGSGVFFARLSVENQSTTKKMLLLK